MPPERGRLAQRAFMLASGFLLCVFSRAFCAEITILYTGDTHAMLYPCNCPVEPDGGVARRASLVGLLRRKYPASLLVDSGAFFAGSASDDHAQNAQLDMRRTQLQVRAMSRMGYDAVALGAEEFHFGDDFLRQACSELRTDVLGCNLEGADDTVTPFTVKTIGGLTVGIIGVTPLSAGQRSAAWKVSLPEQAVSAAVSALRARGVDLIVLLSRLSEAQTRELIAGVAGIGVAVVGAGGAGERPYDVQADTLILRPTWEGRRLGVARLTVEQSRIAGYEVEPVRLSAQVPDDPDVAGFLPACFSDLNCHTRGLTAECVKAGEPDARCVLPDAGEVSCRVITSDDCVTCHPEFVLAELKKHFPRLMVTVVDYACAEAAELIDVIKPEALPVYVFGQEIDKEHNFPLLSDNFVRRGPYYVLKTESSGVSYLLNRPRVPGRFDLFVRLHDQRNAELLKQMHAFDPAIHLLIFEDEQGLRAPGGALELEDALRAVCIRKQAAERFGGYIACRSQQASSSWWQQCAAAMDHESISACARSEEGMLLLKQHYALTAELKILTAPTYLIENQQILSSEVVPREEDLRELINTIKTRAQ